MANIAPIRSSSEISTIINKAQHALADLGWEIVNEEKQGITVQDVYHRDKVYQLLLLDVMLKNILDENGNVTKYYQASANQIKFNNILSGLLDLSKNFDGPAIPMLVARNSTLVFYPSTATSTGVPSGGPATPGGTTFQNLSVNSPGATLDSFSSNLSQFAFYMVSVKGSNGGEGSRMEIISATWSGSNVPVYNEIKTEDVGGITSPITLKVEMSGGNIQLNAYTSTDGWSVQGVRILFQNISFQNALGPLPAGGTTNQLLKKNSNNDYDVSWFTLTVAALTDLLASVTELNYSQGLSGNIQAQINSFSSSLSNYLLKSGGTMSGGIAMGNYKITGLAAGTVNGDSLRYEQLIGLYLLLSGGTMTGALNMGGNKVTGLATATNPSDAVRFDQLPSGILNTTILNIGSWNMSSISFISVNHGLTQSKIRSVRIIINDDAGTSLNQLPYVVASTPVAWMGAVTTTAVFISCTTSAFSSSYSGSGNRGYIIIDSIP